MVADGGEGFAVGDAEAFAERDGGDRAVEEHGVVTVGLLDGDACFTGEAQLLVGREGTKEIVAPGGESHPVAVEVVAFGQVEGFVQDAFDVTDEAFGPRLEFDLEGGDLVTNGAGHQPSGPSWRPPSR